MPWYRLKNCVLSNVLMIGDHHFVDDEARNFLGDYDSKVKNRKRGGLPQRTYYR